MNYEASTHEGEVERQLFADRATLAHDEQRRWELTLNHWDLPIHEVDPHSTSAPVRNRADGALIVWLGRQTTRRDDRLGETLHFLKLWAHLQQQQIEPRLLELGDTPTDLVWRADQIGPQTSVGYRIFLQLHLALELSA